MNKTSTKKCLGCAKEFTFKESITPQRKYCSKRCYLDAGKWGIKPETKEVVEEVKDEKKSPLKRLFQFIKNIIGK